MDPVSTTLSSDAPLSEPARILNTFIAPSKTFTDLQRNATWWGPFVLLCLVIVLFMVVLDRQIGFTQVTKNEMAKSPKRAEQFDKLPPEQKAQQLEFAAKFTKGFSYASPIFALIAYLIAAGVLLGVFNLGAGAGVKFKVALAIVVYANLPWLIHALLAIASMMTGAVDKEGFDINNTVGSNPAYYFEAVGNKFLHGIASAFDIFAIWTIVLMGIGFACNSKVKRSTAIMLVAGTFFAYKLIGASLGALFG